MPRKQVFHSRKAEGASRAEERAHPPCEAWPQRERAARDPGGLGQSGTPSAQLPASPPPRPHRAQPQPDTPILTPHGGRGRERGALRRLPGRDTSGLSRAGPLPFRFRFLPRAAVRTAQALSSASSPTNRLQLPACTAARACPARREILMLIGSTWVKATNRVAVWEL